MTCLRATTQEAGSDFKLGALLPLKTTLPFPREIKTYVMPKLHRSAHGSVSRSRQKAEQPTCPVADEQTLKMCPCNGILVSNKKE